jgi:phosphohistidine phosphatase
MGKRLLKRGTIPEIMIASTANRAFTTAQIMAQEVGFPIEEIIPKSDLFHADPSEILHTVQCIHNTHKSAMLFGHNPGFTWVANQLANLTIDNLPTCGLVVLQFSVDNWTEVAFQKGEMVFYDYPKRIV